MSAKEINIKFTLKLNIEEWGMYKKGDIDTFYIPVFSEDNGLVRFPIDKRWDIVDYVVCEGKELTSENESKALPLNKVSGSTCFHRIRVTTHRGEHCVDCGKRF